LHTRQPTGASATLYHVINASFQSSVILFWHSKSVHHLFTGALRLWPHEKACINHVRNTSFCAGT
jgi:hypothetical protein